jgi:hypothetical protein
MECRLSISLPHSKSKSFLFFIFRRTREFQNHFLPNSSRNLLNLINQVAKRKVLTARDIATRFAAKVKIMRTCFSKVDALS